MKEVLLCFGTETATNHKRENKAGVFPTCRLFVFHSVNLPFYDKNEPYELLTEKWKNEILEQIDVKNRQWGL